MNTLFLMVGISGSGKSVFGTKLASALKISRVSSDDIRGELCNGDMTDQSKNYQVFQTVYERTRKALLENGKVVVDATNKSVKERKEFRKIALECNAQIVAIVMVTNIVDCLTMNAKRNRFVPEHIIERQQAAFVLPTTAEVSKVIFVDWQNDTYETSESRVYTTFEDIIKIYG
jgi:protein phosphatase